MNKDGVGRTYNVSTCTVLHFDNKVTGGPAIWDDPTPSCNSPQIILSCHLATSRHNSPGGLKWGTRVAYQASADRYGFRRGRNDQGAPCSGADDNLNGTFY